MTIPPFPSQDLAKLVLGYLAEEQLMTAYDEFLQASPYLDALMNEYDRIFMTSLKNILAEYRAVKIYVETCKPFSLRKKLVQCRNLLEVVTMLVSYIDVNKIQDAATDKVCVPRQNTSVGLPQNGCEQCISQRLKACVCKSKQGRQSMASAPLVNEVETSSLDNSVETTALEDLPGTPVTTKKKHVKVLEKNIVTESSENMRQSTGGSTSTGNNGHTGNSQSFQSKINEFPSIDLNTVVKTTDMLCCKDKIEEFDNILDKVCNDKTNNTRLYSTSELDISGNRGLNAGFQDFVSGVSGHDNRHVPVPDSSTSENSVAQNFVKAVTEDVANISNELSKNVLHSESQPNNTCAPRVKPKKKEQKIKIISNIKVDNTFPARSNATSTPVMETIVINGTPAYKQVLPNNNFTKDEIMAMPTIIVVPSSAPSSRLAYSQPVLSQKIKTIKPKTAPVTNLLEPLVIDVTSSPLAINNKDSIITQTNPNLPNAQAGLVKTVDILKNASVPKDNIIPGSTQTNTPEMAPPVRKSSSTPRRNSHIRVLDFNTPRRILHETINEKVPEETNKKPVEIIVTRNTDLLYSEVTNNGNDIIDMGSLKVNRIETCHFNKLTTNSDIKLITQKKRDWDADLRALIAAGNCATAQPIVKKPKVKKAKKKAANRENAIEIKNGSSNIPEVKQSRKKRKTSPKDKKSKRRKLEAEPCSVTKETSVTIKPTFNIVPCDLKNTNESANVVKNDSKPNNTYEDIETPETERISLQNEIGAKLNISDLLETPYKQALYDIQMETPKFLGSVLPDEPISDIKIMNIPTPRFFDTPKPTQATPTYSSRGTDYSSGGSYYKPDEQDYLKIPDLECPIISSKEEPPKEITNSRNSRPVRKCTKNVSYKTRSNKKDKLTDDEVEFISTSSDTTNVNTSIEVKDGKDSKTPKTTKNKSKPISKLDIKKKNEFSKPLQSPLKKDKSPFMKLKPRRPTPIKENKRIRKKSLPSQNSSPITQAKRKRGRPRLAPATAVVTCAPTKSRRKSSTPRKLHCTKQFNSESSADSPESANPKAIHNLIRTSGSHDSDTEQLALRWSDDGSQDTKSRVSECEDISKIKEYIETTVNTKTSYMVGKGTFQVDLIKRGFDAETAKIIERDLLDTPPHINQNHTIMEIHIPQSDEASSKKGLNKPSPESQAIEEPEDENDEDDDDIELSVGECNEESEHFIVCNSEHCVDRPRGPPVTLKDTWNMEVCIDDGLTVRLRATALNPLFDHDPEGDDPEYNVSETEAAVNSIANLNSLYTPLKDRRTQCYEIFDSTLTSIDTPLKLSSPKETVTQRTDVQIVVEAEKTDKDKTKRKRLQGSNSSEESSIDNKKTKPEAQYLFNSTNIQDIDIESVLKKLHGP